jgi:hypothetical protein
MFQRFVASVSYGCCICCNGYTCMLQVYVPNVLSVSQTYVASVNLNVAYVSRICCKCLIWMLHMLATAFKCFRAFYKCFRRMLQEFRIYVASGLSECCNGTHLSLPPDAAVRALCMRFPCEVGVGSS